jgi:hypothetical protein
MEEIVSRQLRHLKRRHVRFGSLADICGAKGHVRITPESGHVRCSSVSDKKVNSVMFCRFRGYERRAELAAGDQVIVTTA